MHKQLTVLGHITPVLWGILSICHGAYYPFVVGRIILILGHIAQALFEVRDSDDCKKDVIFR